MYEARVDVKKILMMLITWHDMNTEITSLMNQEVKKYRKSQMESFIHG